MILAKRRLDNNKNNNKNVNNLVENIFNVQFLSLMCSILSFKLKPSSIYMYFLPGYIK